MKTRRHSPIAAVGKGITHDGDAASLAPPHSPLVLGNVIEEAMLDHRIDAQSLRGPEPRHALEQIAEVGVDRTVVVVVGGVSVEVRLLRMDLYEFFASFSATIWGWLGWTNDALKSHLAKTFDARRRGASTPPPSSWSAKWLAIR